MKHTFKLITIAFFIYALCGCQVTSYSPEACTWQRDATVKFIDHYLAVPGGNENILTNGDYSCLLSFITGDANLEQLLDAPNNRWWASSNFTWTVNEVNSRCTVSTNQDKISLDNTNYSCMLNNEYNTISKSAPRLTDYNPENCKHHYELKLTLHSGTILIWEKEWPQINFPDSYFYHSQTEIFYVSSWEHPLIAQEFNPFSVSRRVYYKNQFRQI